MRRTYVRTTAPCASIVTGAVVDPRTDRQCPRSTCRSRRDRHRRWQLRGELPQLVTRPLPGAERLDVVHDLPHLVRRERITGLGHRRPVDPGRVRGDLQNVKLSVLQRVPSIGTTPRSATSVLLLALAPMPQREGPDGTADTPERTCPLKVHLGTRLESSAGKRQTAAPCLNVFERPHDLSFF